MYESGKIISGLAGFDRIRLEGDGHPIHDQVDKYWMKGTFMCEKFSDGPSCNGCCQRCGERPLFVKIYEGKNAKIIQAMENQGMIQIASAYIAKTYGIVKEEDNIFVVTEYIDGKSVSDFCREMGNIKNTDSKRMLTEREKLVLKYRLMNQMLYAVRDYQKYRQEELGVGVHLDLKSEHFLVKKGKKWNDVQIKLIDFEGFTNYHQQPSAFQLTEEYAHPMHKVYFEDEFSPTQIRPFWDYYALGLVFYEMLEGEILFSKEERQAQKHSSEMIQKKIVLNKHDKEMTKEERRQMTNMLEKMISLTEPWETVEEIIAYMKRFINQWIRREELHLIRSAEFLMREEYDFWYAPYIKVQFMVNMPNQIPFYQSYEIMEGGIISLIYDANLPILKNRRKPAAYLFENGGIIKCFLLEQEEMLKLSVGTKLLFEECSMQVCAIQKIGYETQTVEYVETDADLI